MRRRAELPPPSDPDRPPGRSRSASRGRGGARQAPGRDELRAGPLLRWIGSFTVQRALIVFFGAAVIGVAATLVTGGEPGSLLGNLIVLGAVIAALGIRRRAAYVLIPLPALTYLVLATATGVIHDNGTVTSTTQLGLDFLQWIGNGFFSLCAATILVLLIFGARLLASRQLVSGSFPMSAQRPAAGRPGRAPLSPGDRPDSRRDDHRRTSRAPWDDPDPWYDQGPSDRDHWNERDRRGARDSRGDGEDSRQGRRPDRRGGGDDWRRDDRRSGSRNVPPDRGDPPTRAMPPGRSPRPDRDSRDRRDTPGGTSRGDRESGDRRDHHGGSSRGGRDSREGYDRRDR
jgi:hypothetical protein